MPVILKTGNLVKKHRPWWTMIIWVCGRCSCEFKVLETDRPLVYEERSPNGLRRVEYSCPYCGAKVEPQYRVAPRGREDREA